MLSIGFQHKKIFARPIDLDGISLAISLAATVTVILTIPYDIVAIGYFLSLTTIFVRRRREKWV
jgi:hypothetical protein